jgi:hypothetical protein
LLPATSPLHRWVVPSAEIISVGLPFCVFKLLTGLVALGTPLAPLGVALLALGAFDTALNLGNLATLLVARRRLTWVCTTDLLLRRRDDDLGVALDVFVSFTLVAVVIGFGLLARVPAPLMPLWNAAVVLNVLGAGIGRLLGTRRRPAADPADGRAAFE